MLTPPPPDREVELKGIIDMRAFESPVAGGERPELASKPHGGLIDQRAHRGRRALELQLDRLGGVVGRQVRRRRRRSPRRCNYCRTILSVGPEKETTSVVRRVHRIDRPSGRSGRPHAIDPLDARGVNEPTQTRGRYENNRHSPLHRSTLSEKVPVSPLAKRRASHSFVPPHTAASPVRPGPRGTRPPRGSVISQRYILEPSRRVRKTKAAGSLVIRRRSSLRN